MPRDDPAQELLTRLKSEGFSGRVEIHLSQGSIISAVLRPAGRARYPDFFGLERRPQAGEGEEE